MLPLSIKEKAINLRKKGFSLKEISGKLSIAKSTASEWLSDIQLSPIAQERLKKKQILGQYKTILLKKLQKEKLTKQLEYNAQKIVGKLTIERNIAKILCSLIYYCEGSKGSDHNVTFINSDPTLIKLFLTLLRTGFSLNETKFRILMHLHKYHNESIQKQFWSKITKIPNNQFMKTYQKFNTSIRTRNDYQGCISVRYYDAKIAKELLAFYRVFAKRIS